MKTKTPTELLEDLKDCFNLKTRGSIDEAKYLSMKQSILNQILHNDYYLLLSSIERAEKLRDISAITEEECAEITELALDDNDPDKQANAGKLGKIWYLIAVISLCILLFPFIIIYAVFRIFIDTYGYEAQVKKKIIKDAVKSSRK